MVINAAIAHIVQFTTYSIRRYDYDLVA